MKEGVQGSRQKCREQLGLIKKNFSFFWVSVSRVEGQEGWSGLWGVRDGLRMYIRIKNNFSVFFGGWSGLWGVGV